MKIAMDVRIQKEDFLSAPTISTLLRSGQIEELSGHLLLCRENNAIFCQHGEHGTGVGDGLHSILDCDREHLADIEDEPRATYSGITVLTISCH
jgi:hypothetical protein